MTSKSDFQGKLFWEDKSDHMQVFKSPRWSHKSENLASSLGGKTTVSV